MATYVSELRRNADAKKVKVEYRDGTVVEKIVVGKPISLSDVRGNLLRDLGDVADSAGTPLSGITTNIQDGSLLVFNSSNRRFETTTTLGRTDRPNQKQTINGGEY
jgi:hypothetical protein